MSTVHIHFTARHSGSLQRAAGLERLLARAGRVVDIDAWRATAFAAIAAPGAPLPAVAAAAAAAAASAGRAQAGAAAGPLAAVSAVTAGCVCVATPLHFVAGMSNLTLPENGLLVLDADEAQTFVAEFNRAFGAAPDRDLGRVQLEVGRGGLLLCALERDLDVRCIDPEELVGADVYGAQPSGADAAPLRRLMSEIEMWLFDLALNRARTARGVLPVSALWLWGIAPPLQRLPIVNGWTAGEDPLFTAFGNAPRLPRDARSGVLVCRAAPGTVEWLDVERDWLTPLAASLRAGRIDCIQVSAARRLFVVGRRNWWRVWRRPQPWWSYFDLDEELHAAGN